MAARRPVSTPVRALAAFAYLLPVAIVLLALPAYRQVRLIRVHALSSIVMGTGIALIFLVLGAMRPAGLEFAILVSLGISAALLFYFGATLWGAIWAYQGKNPPMPGIRVLAERFEKRLAPRREVV